MLSPSCVTNTCIILRALLMVIIHLSLTLQQTKKPWSCLEVEQEDLDVPHIVVMLLQNKHGAVKPICFVFID